MLVGWNKEQKCTDVSNVQRHKAAQTDRVGREVEVATTTTVEDQIINGIMVRMVTKRRSNAGGRNNVEKEPAAMSPAMITAKLLEPTALLNMAVIPVVFSIQKHRLDQEIIMIRIGRVEVVVEEVGDLLGVAKTGSGVVVAGGVVVIGGLQRVEGEL